MVTIDERIAIKKTQIADCARTYESAVEDGKLKPELATEVMERLLAELDGLLRIKNRR